MPDASAEQPQDSANALPSEQVFTIHCRTGCTCCSGDNHFRGPYRTNGDALRRVAHFRNPGNKFCPVFSHYAHRGAYTIYEEKMEKLPDGRAIIRCEVMDKTPEFIEVADDGSVEDNRKEHLDIKAF